MSDLLDSTPCPEGLDIPAADWQQTPLSVRLLVLALLKRLEALEARMHQNSSNSSRPPSTDAPSTKHHRRMKAAERRRPGGKPGHPGHQQLLLEPTDTVALFPEMCSCGQAGFANLIPYRTHQVIELPVIHPEVTHWILHQGRCLSCGTLCKASLPSVQRSGYGPRLTGFIGEIAGIVGASRSAVQDLCASVCGISLSKGAIQKLVDRVSEAIVPYYNTIGQVARTAPVNYIDETSWLVHGDRHWLWVMANPEVAYFQIHPTRSNAAFVQLIADWMGILVSDGYLVYQLWQGLRQSCVAHLLRTAKGLGEHLDAGIARFRHRVHTELQRLCHMGTERPTVGQWRAWYARFHHPLNQHTARETKPGRLPGVWHEKASRYGYSWTCRVSKPQTTWRSVPTASACCGANGAKGHAVRRGIAGWSGCCRYGTHAVFVVGQRVPSWSRRFRACSKARRLILTGSPITSL